MKAIRMLARKTSARPAWPVWLPLSLLAALVMGAASALWAPPPSAALPVRQQTIPAMVVLDVTKALVSPAAPRVGDLLTYQVTLRNVYQSPVTTITSARDTFDPSCLAFHSSTPPGSNDGQGHITWGDLTVPLGDIPTGGSIVVTVRFTALAACAPTTNSFWLLGMYADGVMAPGSGSVDVAIQPAAPVTATYTPVHTATATFTPSPTVTASPTATSSATATATGSVPATATRTATRKPTLTPSPTETGTTTATPTETATPSLTLTPLPTSTPVAGMCCLPGYPDYAPAGLPDFGQRQVGWQNPQTGAWSYDGPVALADALWWLDSRYETGAVPPPAVSDSYPLVRALHGATWDDHAPGNARLLVGDLAYLAATDGQGTAETLQGTAIEALHAAAADWVAAVGLEATLLERPAYAAVRQRFQEGQAIVLLLGFWERQDGEWARLGGHYVALACVDCAGGLGERVSLSDPWFDRAESGWPGLVQPPAPHGHPTLPPDAVHNDATFVSWDLYAVLASAGVGDRWGLTGYAPAYADVAAWAGLNFGAALEPYRAAHAGGEIVTVVDYALAIGPAPATPTATPSATESPTHTATATPSSTETDTATPTTTPTSTATRPPIIHLPLLLINS